MRYYIHMHAGAGGDSNCGINHIICRVYFQIQIIHHLLYSFDNSNPADLKIFLFKHIYLSSFVP